MLRLARNIVAPTIVVQPGVATVGWKKAWDRTGFDHVIVKLAIPEDAKRVNGYGSRKCRAEFADVVDIQSLSGESLALTGTDVRSVQKPAFKYVVGQRVTPDEYYGGRDRECAGGVHFFAPREEAVAYDFN